MLLKKKYWHVVQPKLQYIHIISVYSELADSFDFKVNTIDIIAPMK